MRASLRRVGVTIVVAFAVVLSACGGGAADDDAALSAATESLELAQSTPEVEAAVRELLAMCAAEPGSAQADAAFDAALDGFRDKAAWAGEPFFADATPEPPTWITTSIGDDTVYVRSLLGLAQQAPEPYRDIVYKEARSALETIGAEWVRRLAQVSSDRTAWVKSMQGSGRAGGVDGFLDNEVEELAYQRELLALDDGASGLQRAFGSIAHAVLFSNKNQPASYDADATTKSLTAYYTTAELAKADSVAKAIVVKVQAAKRALSAAAGE